MVWPCVLFVDFRLEKNRQNVKRLDPGQNESGHEPGKTCREHDPSENSQEGVSSVAGKRRRVASIVGRVMKRIMMGKAHTIENQPGKEYRSRRRPPARPVYQSDTINREINTVHGLYALGDF